MKKYCISKGSVVCMIIMFITTAINGQQKDSAVSYKLAHEILVNSTAYENLRFLCKKIGPRMSGSANAEKAVHATARMLKEAGADTVYLQECMVPNWVRGEKETGYLQVAGESRHVLRLCALGNSTGTGKKGIEAKVIEVKSLAELHQLGRYVKGSIVFFNMAMDPKHIRTFRAYGESGAGRRSGPAQAAKYGAIGVMVRSLASNIDKYPHTGATQYNDSFPKIPAVAISTEDAEWLSAKLKSGSKVTGYFRTMCKTLPDVRSYNVIGEIKGTELPDQIITVGGHLDSWDLGEGAQDDGAGCVQSIEVIRALKATGLHPKRTVRAVMFMDEENGGRGADKYLEVAKKNKEQHLFALESDAGGFTPRGFSLDMKPEQRQKIISWKNLFLPFGVYELFPGGSGADIGPLKELGTSLAGFSPDSQRYFDLHHAPNDTFEAVSKRELDLGTVNMALMIWLVSEYGL